MEGSPEDNTLLRQHVEYQRIMWPRIIHEIEVFGEDAMRMTSDEWRICESIDAFEREFPNAQTRDEQLRKLERQEKRIKHTAARLKEKLEKASPKLREIFGVEPWQEDSVDRDDDLPTFPPR